MNRKAPAEAKAARVTVSLKEGYANDPAALAAPKNCEATPHGRSAAWSNPQVDEQEPHRRPSGPGELAQHSETVRFRPAGKWGDCAGEDCVLTWGGLPRESAAGVSRGHSSRENEPGARCP
jgi:hypothetical protein